MKDYASYSYWLQSCGDDLTPRPALNGTIDADIAILGAGYSGLWTAWYLLERNPDLSIAIVEREIAGFGASGRNGGWCTSGFPTSLDRIEEKYGRAQAIATHRAMTGAVDEVGRVAREQGIDIDWQKSGTLMTARGIAQLPSVHHVAKSMERLGFEDEFDLLDKKQLDERIRIAGSVGAIFLRENAVIHPGKLVRGLARAVERRGATIYEQSNVTSFTGGAYPALHTDQGHVRARTVVLCGESYMSGLKGVGRQLMPVYSLITLTEPLTAEQRDAIGWRNRELVDSCRYTVDYLSKTIDGRILFGGRGAPYHLRSKITRHDRHAETHKMLEDNVRTGSGAQGRANLPAYEAWWGGRAFRRTTVATARKKTSRPPGGTPARGWQPPISLDESWRI
ncbi:MAG: FAD-binding oxidoreductase [Thermomicrobiales bacterium]|nr:FAD-binding oxidoreductase [Thermomicrobiales bacterium]